MKLVIIESPLGKRVDGTVCTSQELAENLVYARACMADSLRRGEAPYGSHLLYPQCLDDFKPEERKLGMEAGFAWGDAAARIARIERTREHGSLCGCGPCLGYGPDSGTDAFVAVYVDRGITPGMQTGIERHRLNGLNVVERRLGGGWLK